MSGVRGPAFALSFSLLFAFSFLPAFAEPILEWQDLYDGGVLQTDAGAAVAVDVAGNPVIAGQSIDSIGGADMLIRKLDRDGGSTIWTRRISAEDGNDMLVAGVVRDGDGDFLVGGTRQGCYG
jgi:outer membrane protein assembly factor BamB